MERNAQTGLRPERLAMLVRRAVEEMSLDLSGVSVLTEAATGAYVVTPVIAAMAGAAVVAVTRTTRYGTVEEVTQQTMQLADQLGVADRITIQAEGPTDEVVASADIVTNSGHVRPIDERMIGCLRPNAVVSLMYEAWELDVARDDVDVDALRRRGIKVAGTNERHPAVDNFSYLGPMAVKLLNDAGVAGYRSRLWLVCDNQFADYLRVGLERVGAVLHVSDGFDGDVPEDLDGVVVALTPTGGPVLSESDIVELSRRAPGVVMAQVWGDVPRDWCDAHGVSCVPAVAPSPGHMGILPSALGPEPIVRLQTGGLKVGEVLLRPEDQWTDSDRSFIDEL